MKTRAILLVVLTTFVFSIKVNASTIIVSNGNDNGTGSLREAINNAQNGDTITFEQSVTEITLTSQIVINKSMTIAGNPGILISSTSNMPRVFYVSNTANTIIIHLSNLLLKAISLNIVTEKTDGGIILVDNPNSDVSIDNCFFTYKAGGGYVTSQTNQGGGIALYNGSVTITNCAFTALSTSSKSGSAGGAIFQISGNLTLINCTFCNNSSANGTAVYTLNSQLDVSNCTFADNRHYNWLSSGQAIAIFNSNVNIKNSIFNDNQSEIYGTFTSGGYNVFPQKSTLIYCTILGDTATNKYCGSGNFNYTQNGHVICAENGFWIPTCSLVSSSCCIDALPTGGNGAPNLDQRGFIRVNNPDIGSFEYNGVASFLTVSETALTIGALANSTKTFDITSNSSWTVVSNQNWLTVNSPTGTNNSTVTLTAEANPANATRAATVTVSVSGGPSQKITVTQDAKPSGISDIRNENYSIYPNPANSILYVNLTIDNPLISIVDMKGNLFLFKKQFTDNKIDISGLQKGIYLIKIENNNSRITRKFVKN